ncbi:MAG: UvrD-helicase domain-containing protein [Pseudomonadales bacterium]
MKFIAIDKSAAKTLVSMRNLQSTEFDTGKKLAKIISEGVASNELLDEVAVIKLKDGISLVGDSPDFDSQLIIDLEQFSSFRNLPESDALTVFQKTCRVALKYWEKIPFSSREFFKSGEDLIILIPKKNSLGDGSKVLIDVKPDWNRQEKRNTHHLLVFHYGVEEFSTKPSTTNFRKAVEESKGKDTDRSLADDHDVPLRVNRLEAAFKPIDANTNFETWRQLLTKSQYNFVFRDNHGPERIEGAAGTGKTLSLALRCCNVLNSANSGGKSLNAVFLTHSYASKEHIESIIYPKIEWYEHQGSDYSIQLLTTTLQEWCVSTLGNKISETELLDKDAQNSKDYQQILLSEVFNEFKKDQFPSHSKFISKELTEFLSTEDEALLIQSLQHEIAELIKGRAGQDLNKYKKTNTVAHSLPLKETADFECIFGLYTAYQRKLETAGYFDSDDVILSALGQLDSPIWRRRKNIEGFDVMFVDETHLFNLNELAVMHHLLKDERVSNIIYSVDRSQSLANVSLESEQLDEVFGNDERAEVNLKTIFRSSPDIVRLAFSILSSGSTLFTNMENPLDKIENSFTSDDERRSKKPYCVEFGSDDDVVAGTFQSVDNLVKEISSKRSKVIIIATTESVMVALERYALDQNKPATFIKKRGDKKAQIDAEKGNKYIMSGIDYVGGLEFEGAVIVGVDRGHMPAMEENDIDSKHFLNHASYNRMYVAITRAKYGVVLLYSSARGVSKLLDFPIQEGVVEVQKA